MGQGGREDLNEYVWSIMDSSVNGKKGKKNAQGLEKINLNIFNC
jgi:hypothetical protein